jgi:hypothetical protein
LALGRRGHWCAPCPFNHAIYVTCVRGTAVRVCVPEELPLDDTKMRLTSDRLPQYDAVSTGAYDAAEALSFVYYR